MFVYFYLKPRTKRCGVIVCRHKRCVFLYKNRIGGGRVVVSLRKDRNEDGIDKEYKSEYHWQQEAGEREHGAQGHEWGEKQG